MKKIALFLVCAGWALGSGTITSGSRGYDNCPISTFEGRITGVNLESGELSLMSPKKRAKKFRVNDQTSYRIPGVNKQLLKEAPLTRLRTDSEAKIAYCSNTESVLEVKVR